MNTQNNNSRDEEIPTPRKCPKPGCGASNEVGNPCTDFDCPQRIEWAVNLRHAEKINQRRFSVPIYNGGHLVGRAFGPTMEAAIENADLMASAPKLRSDLIRLSAERETELDSKAPINRDINDMELIDDLKRTLAERDKELAEVKALVETLTENNRQHHEHWCDQLLAAETVNGKLREALSGLYNYEARRSSPDTAYETTMMTTAREALALSPDPTLLDEVVKDKDRLDWLENNLDRLQHCSWHNFNLGRLVTFDGEATLGECKQTLRQAIDKALSRLRQSTRETEEKV